MNLIDREKTPTVIIAYREPGNHLEASFQDLKRWFKNIVVVGPKNSHILQVVKNSGGSWIVSDSPHIAELWEKGIRAQNSDWYMLVQDKEYLSTNGFDSHTSQSSFFSKIDYRNNLFVKHE